MAEKPQPVRVLYCDVCGLPAEYCEFGPDFEKCKPWLIRNAPHVYPDLVKEAGGQDAADNVSDQHHFTSISDVGSSSNPKEEVKRLPGGKVKKKESVMPLLEAAGGAALSTDEADRIYMQVVGGVKKQRIRGTDSYGSSIASDGRTYARHGSSYSGSSVEELVNQRLDAEIERMNIEMEAKIERMLVAERERMHTEMLAARERMHTEMLAERERMHTEMEEWIATKLNQMAELIKSQGELQAATMMNQVMKSMSHSQPPQP